MGHRTHPDAWNFDAFKSWSQETQLDVIFSLLRDPSIVSEIVESPAFVKEANHQGLDVSRCHIEMFEISSLELHQEDREVITIFHYSSNADENPARDSSLEPDIQGSGILTVDAEGGLTLHDLTAFHFGPGEGYLFDMERTKEKEEPATTGVRYEGEDLPPLTVYVDPGAADAETISKLFLALSVLYEAEGGPGLQIVNHETGILAGEEVPV